MKNLFTVTLFLLISFACSNKTEPQVNPILEEVSINNEVIVDKDSVFCNKILDCILEESKAWPVNYVFEKQGWKLNSKKHSVDFDFLSGLEKEVHYYTRDKNNPFSGIYVDYYVYKDEQVAKEIIADYKKALSVGFIEEDMIKGKVIGSGFMKIPTILYKQGSTIFQIRSDNGVVHIVYKALSKLKEKENIDINNIVPE